MMHYCDLHFQAVDRRGCPWCQMESVETDNKRLRDAMGQIVEGYQHNMDSQDVYGIAKEALEI